MNPTRFYIVTETEEAQAFRHGLPVRPLSPETHLSIHRHLFSFEPSGITQVTAVYEVARETAEFFTRRYGRVVYLYTINAGQAFFNLDRSLVAYLREQRVRFLQSGYRDYLLSIRRLVMLDDFQNYWITNRDIEAENVLSVQIFSLFEPTIGYSNANARHSDEPASDSMFPIAPPPLPVPPNEICYTHIGTRIIPTRFMPPWNVSLEADRRGSDPGCALTGRKLVAILTDD